MTVVSIEEVNAALRLDLQNDGGSPVTFDDDRLPDVEMKLSQAEDIVRAYLKIEATDWPPDEISDRLKAAIILAFQALFEPDPKRPDPIADLHQTPPAGPLAGLLRLDRMPTLA